MMGHNWISADGLLGAQSGACIVIAPCDIPVSVVEKAKGAAGCFELRIRVFLEVRKGSFLAAR